MNNGAFGAGSDKGAYLDQLEGRERPGLCVRESVSVGGCECGCG